MSEENESILKKRKHDGLETTEQDDDESNNSKRRSSWLPSFDFHWNHELVFPGIVLPIHLGEAPRLLFNNTATGEAKIVFHGIVEQFGNLRGREKADPDALDDIHKSYIEHIVKPRRLPEGYKFFGNGKNQENLKHFLLTNPFFISALAYHNSFYYISSIAKGNEYVVSKFTKLEESYEKSFPRVNGKFDHEMNLISYQVFINEEDHTASFTSEKACAHLLFLLLHYAEVIHATLHILDFILVSALYSACDGLPMLKPWAKEYYYNVPLKELEVRLLLFADDGKGSLCGAFWKANRDEVLAFGKDILMKIIKMTTTEQFLNEFVFEHIPVNHRHGLLTEFMKHASMVPSFAHDLIDAFLDADERDVADANQSLHHYLQEIGAGKVPMNHLKQFVQILSMIGLFHSGTFSFSRLIITTQILPLFFPNNLYYTEVDEGHCGKTLGTTDGIEPGRHVFTSKLEEYSSLPKGVKEVLKNYDAKAIDMKEAYFQEIMKRKDFLEYGWIWSDYVPDKIDNKQVTMTTYV